MMCAPWIQKMLFKMQINIDSVYRISKIFLAMFKSLLRAGIHPVFSRPGSEGSSSANTGQDLFAGYHMDTIYLNGGIFYDLWDEYVLKRI
jgi:hypothetical protein